MYPFLYRHLLSRLDAESAHNAAIRFFQAMGRIPLGCALLRRLYAPPPTAPITAFGLRFPHPLGLAGGFDKRAACLPALAALGFGHIEVGTITPRPQMGNPRPRLFRLPADEGLINRMGFPSPGMDAAAANLERWQGTIPIFISVGKNKETPLETAADDYRAVLRRLHPYGDAFTVNISSPNTPELRRLQTPTHLAALLSALRGDLTLLGDKPLLVKIAPDLALPELDTVIDLAIQHGVAGIVATNTTLSREGLVSPLAGETGGVSGRPLRAQSTAIIRHIHRTAGGRLTIIGVGGIFTADDVREKLDAGATLVQAYTGFIYRGLGFVKSTSLPIPFDKTSDGKK
ncbi:MAG TPA: quinone-dependent dihydroorotate dehydrogenase [Aggregatilineales bacterium]|nr:quinone-dependent dihydroorotate dehydrogenase [Anaerolineales bacterium]HRE46845.1 quinone-dependent dihydroorotate dehydrogenase [Aggregatilineales bacterium]